METSIAAFHCIDVNNVRFQQDGAISHTSYTAINLLRRKFDGRLISRSSQSIGLQEPAIIYRRTLMTNQRQVSI